MCSALRAAGAIVHNEARGEGSVTVLRGRLPPCPLVRRAPTASADDTSVGTRSAGRDGVSREAAGGVHQPLPRLVLGELPLSFRDSLRRAPACVRLLRFRFRLCGAAQRYPPTLWTAPSAPRRSSSATHAESPLRAA
jgi:hypothetical protein